VSSIGAPVRIFAVAAITALALFAASFWALSQVGVGRLEARSLMTQNTASQQSQDAKNKPCPPKGNYGNPGQGKPNQGSTEGQGKKCGHQ
jgi:hypothetical protein